MFLKDIFALSLIFCLISCESCDFQTKSVVIEVNKSQILRLSCDEEIKDIKFDPKFDGTVKIVGRNGMELSIMKPLVKRTYKIMINNLYESIVEISSTGEEFLPRSLFQSERKAVDMEERELLETEDPNGNASTPPPNTTPPPETNPPYTLPPDTLPPDTLPPYTNPPYTNPPYTTPPPPEHITLADFYSKLDEFDYAEKDYLIDDITGDEMSEYEDKKLEHTFNGVGHTFTFTFKTDQNVALQLYKSTRNTRITNIRFIFDMSNSLINDTGIFGDVKNSIFYNVHITIKNNNGMEITYSGSETVNGLFCKRIESSSLVHVGIFIEDNLNIVFKYGDDVFNPIDTYYGFITGSFVDDTKSGAGGLFVQTHDINLNGKDLDNNTIHFGGLIGNTSIQLGDSVVIYNNVIIVEVYFGGLIGECISCQISTSFVEMNDINIKGSNVDVGGLVSLTKDDISRYSLIYYCYFKLNGNFNIDDKNKILFGGIVGKPENYVIIHTIIVDIITDTFKSGNGDCNYIVGGTMGDVTATNSLVIGSSDVGIINMSTAEFKEVYTIGFKSSGIPALDKTDNVSYYLNNITYPFKGIEGFTERSEILLIKNSDNIYSLSYLDNTWDFYYLIPGGLSSPYDISTITSSNDKFTMKILPKKSSVFLMTIRICQQYIDEIYSEQDIFDVSANRNAIITVPTTMTTPEDYIIIHNMTFVLYTAMYYDKSKIDNVFISKTINDIDINSTDPVLVSILKDNMMRVSINCTNTIVKYTGDIAFEGSKPFEFTYTYDPSFEAEFDTSETCKFKFLGTTIDSVEVVINFKVKNDEVIYTTPSSPPPGTSPPPGSVISITTKYPNHKTKQEVDLTVSITTTPTGAVYFVYNCPADLICNITSFSIANPSDLKIIHISQKNPTTDIIAVDLSFNISSSDPLYQGLSPYIYSFLLNNVEPEYLIEPPSFKFSSFTPIESSYKILTTTIPTANIKVTVDFSNCSYYYNITPTSFTLSSINDFVGIFNITPNISSLTSDFNCIISNNLETLASEYAILNNTLNVSINTKFEDLTPAPKLLYVNESEDENTMILYFDRNCYASEGLIKLYQNDTSCNGKFFSTDVYIAYQICLWMDRKTLKIYYEGVDDLPSTTVYLEENVLRSTDTSSEYSTGISVVNLRAANPEMTSAKFDDGYRITLEFDNNIGYGITDGELCFNIFNSSKSLGSSTCSFGKDKKTVVIDLSADAEIMPGDIIIPLPNKIKGSINSKKYSETSLVVLPPSPLPTVTAVADYPARFTSCQSLIIDGSSSSGGGSRSLNYIWEDLTGNENVTEYLYSNSAILTIPSGVLEENITIRMNVTNFFGETNTTTMKIEYVDKSILQSSIEGSPNLTLKTDKELYVKGHGNLIDCGETTEIFNILSEFSLYRIDESASQIEIETNNFTTKDPSRLYFAPHSLSIGNYKIKYNITMDQFGSSVSEVNLNVVLGDFYFNVKGYPVMSLPNTDKLTLAVEAKDLDVPDISFDYNWECNSDKSNPSECNSMVISKNSPTVTFDGDTFSPGIYNFTSTAYPDDDSNRKMSVYILVTLTDGTMKLSFSIESVFSNSTVYKPSDIIGLRAKIEDSSDNNLRYSWVYMSDNLLNPLLSRNDSSLVYVSCEKMNTKLISHTIRFYVYKGNQNLYSDYVFIVVEPPKGGFLVSSSNEVYLGDSIVISSSNWEGAKEFTYRFGVLVNGNLNYLQPIYGSSNKYNGMLPLGDKQKDYNLTLIVFVKDKYGAISNTTNGKDGKSLIIQSHPISSIDNIKNITKKLEEENNYDQIFNFANGIKNQITSEISSTTKCVNGNRTDNNSSCNCFANYTGTLCDIHIPIDGGLSVNYTYSEPDRKCGKITQYRWKTCDNPKPEYGGKECEIIKEEIIKVEPCENDNNIDGGWGNWSDWSECSAKCKIYNGNEVEGIKSRNRLCNNPQPYNEGKECEGNSTESVKCYKSCVAPKKLCPGEYMNSEGKAVGSKCSGRGECIINRVGCKEYEPNCHSSCECYEGYSGSSCQYTVKEYENNKEIKSNLISSINIAIENTVITPESVEQQSSTILNVIDPPIDLDDKSLALTYTIIDNTISKLKDDKPSEISSNSINDYVKATSLLIQNEWAVSTKAENRRKLQSESKYSIGSQLIGLYKNISVIHYNQQYSAPLQISTDSLGISLIKADLSFDPNASLSINQADVDLGNVIETNSTTEIAIFDFIDNPNVDDSIRTNRTSGLTSITLSNEKGEMNVSVSDINKPIYYRQRLNDDTPLRHIRCSYYDGEDLKYTGVVLIGVIKVENGSNYALCAMLHLTDFAISKKSIFPKMNFVNPIGDAKLLGNYDSSNMLVPIILGSVLVLCIVFWIYTKCKDKDEDRIVNEEKARNFLLYGKLRPSRKEEEKNDKDDKDASMKKHFFKYYAQRLLDEHKILAPGFQSINELMEISRSQNVLCLTAVILTDTAVNALFFGSNPANIAQVVTTSIISTLVMLPVTMIIPFFFKFANTYKSHTLQSKSKNKKSKLSVLKCKLELIKKQIMSQNSTLFKYQMFMLIESGIFIILELIFTIIALIILPSGYVTVVIVGLFVLYILETFVIFVVTTLKQPFYFMYMFVIDFLFMLFNFAILVFYFIILGRNETVLYNTWKFLYDISSTQEVYCLYIEESLNCCGWNDISDYNITDCTTINAYVSGNQNSCKDIYYNKFDQYSPLWIIYFLIGIIAFIPKLVVLVKYVLYQFNQFEKVMEEDQERLKQQIKSDEEKTKSDAEKENSMDEEEKKKRKAAGEMVVRSCRKLLFKRRFIREREYIIWLRNRKIRAGMLIFANFIVCLYILIMIYINLLYGVKFESSQANEWIISSVVSMVIDVILQEPSMILLKTVASTTLTSIIPF